MDVAATLNKLFDRMYVIGETSGSLQEWDAAVAGAAGHIADRMKDPSLRDELLRPLDEGVTPLIFASMNGYPQVVDALLRFDSVRATLERPGPKGMTAWQWSNVAPQLTFLAIHPTIRENESTLIPYLVKTPYYTHDRYAPYQRVRSSLAAAGAKQDPTPVREFLTKSSVCPEAVKERVKGAADILTVLLDVVVKDPVNGLPSLRPPSEKAP